MANLTFTPPNFGDLLVARYGFTSVSSMDSNGTTVWSGDKDIPEVAEGELSEYTLQLQAEYEAQEYARNRKIEYDALNQLELISDDAINGTTTHKDAVNAIKTKYPKG
jgi:hypothetical protein